MPAIDVQGLSKSFTANVFGFFEATQSAVHVGERSKDPGIRVFLKNPYLTPDVLTKKTLTLPRITQATPQRCFQKP